MNPHNQKSELEQSNQNLLLQFFQERIFALEALSSKQITLSKQNEILKLRHSIERYVREHRYSYFQIVLLSTKDNLDLDKPDNGILIRNFQVFLEGKNYSIPRRYYIAIHPNWTVAQYFQLSVSGLRINEELA